MSSKGIFEVYDTIAMFGFWGPYICNLEAATALHERYSKQRRTPIMTLTVVPAPARHLQPRASSVADVWWFFETSRGGTLWILTKEFSGIYEPWSTVLKQGLRRI